MNQIRYQDTLQASKGTFAWDTGTPSIFASIKSMQATHKGGLTASQACTQLVDKRRTETGICPVRSTA